ncbi:right-handed parallel beta-helix repeat-containing protein [Methanobrevibacter arboriphilus]|uniref:right-handed parallel beta-helix repeat-containing protein n=1 Tax=Methanobrevibacter arboriphilus TaxID=39441 RepID=UPI0005B2A7C9|nr:right-handed parallel beta-helix repeat-containing protein [Methanobrevibacter arboriphilus]
MNKVLITNKNKLSILMLLIFCLFALTISTVSASEPTTININSTNGTLNDSINSIDDGSEGIIKLADGTYKGVKNVNITFNNKNITIVGNSRDKTIIDGEGANWNTNWFINAGSNARLSLINVTLKGFTSSGALNDSAAIKNQGDNLYISGVTIKESYPQKGASNPIRPALIWNSGDNFLIENSLIISPGIFEGPARTIATSGNYCTVDNVTIYNPNRYGIDNWGDYFTIKNSLLTETNPFAISSMVCCPIQSSGNHILFTNITVSNFPCCPIAFDGDNVTLSYIKGYNNSETLNFAATNVKILHSYFDGGKDSAISIVGGGNIWIENSTFKNCKDSAINNAPSASTDSPGYNVTVKDCVFESSERAIKNAGDNFTVLNSNFTKNSGDFGAGIYNKAKGFLIDGCIFTNNYADNGGAIYQDENGTMNIKNSKFINNRAEYGNAIFIQYSEMNTSKSEFINNNVYRGTDAIYNENSNSYSTNLNVISATQAKNGGKITVKVKSTGINGVIVKSQNVSLKIGQKTITGKTDSNGIATFTYTPTKTGKLIFQAISNDAKINSTQYKKATVSSSIADVKLALIKQASDKTKTIKKGKIYQKTIQWKNTGNIAGSKIVTIDLKKYKLSKASYKYAKKVSLKNGKLTIKLNLAKGTTGKVILTLRR